MNRTSKKTSLVRALRSLRGLSQGGLARRLGCSQARISRIERGHVIPPLKDARRLAKALGAEVECLFPHSK